MAVLAGDKLDIGKLNALPQPMFVRLAGSQSWWPVETIDVQTGLCRMDVCGKLDRFHFSSVMQIRDLEGGLHDPDDFYVEEHRDA